MTYATEAWEDGFDHIDPFCQYSQNLVTPDREGLMLALHYMRRDDTRRYFSNITAFGSVAHLLEGQLTGTYLNISVLLCAYHSVRAFFRPYF